MANGRDDVIEQLAGVEDPGNAGTVLGNQYFAEFDAARNDVVQGMSVIGTTLPL